MLDDRSRRQIIDSSKEFDNMPGESVKEMVRAIVGTTSESTTILGDGATLASGGEGEIATAPSRTPALDKYTINLTERAGGR